MSSKWGFKSAEHALNYHTKVQRTKNNTQPVKVFTGEELKKLAVTMGYSISDKHVDSTKDTVVASDLPDSLLKYAKKGARHD